MEENREVCDYPIDCQVNYIFNVHKSMKCIVRIVHLPSVVHSEFYEAMKVLFVHKENKNNDIYSMIRHLSVSV